MKISIIGAGNIGATLARRLIAKGHSVRIANSRGPETLIEVAQQTGATAVTSREAIDGVDVVILSVPFGSLPQLRELLSGLPRDVVVADTSNYFPYRDGQVAAVDNGQVESLWVAEQIGRPVIKAWNNALAATLTEKGCPLGTEGRIALSVAGDNPAGKKTIMSLVEDTGFDAIDGGSLAESWRQQPITRVSQQRDAIMKEFASRGDQLTTADIVRLNRTMGA